MLTYLLNRFKALTSGRASDDRMGELDGEKITDQSDFANFESLTS